MKPIAESETQTIKRSQINLNPYNPKRHTEEAIKRQKRNYQKVGFLGGITWNKLTGNLIDGHRRICALDLLYRYDGTPLTDYEVKVEAVELDAKQEKEQMTYMAIGNTKADLNLIAKYAPDIDLTDLGFDNFELDFLQDFGKDIIENQQFADFGEDLLEPTPTFTPDIETESESDREAKKQHMIEVKQENRANAQSYGEYQNAYFTCSFSTYEAKTAFLETFGFDPHATFIKGEELLEKLE